MFVKSFKAGVKSFTDRFDTCFERLLFRYPPEGCIIFAEI